MPIEIRGRVDRVDIFAGQVVESEQQMGRNLNSVNCFFPALQAWAERPLSVIVKCSVAAIKARRCSLALPTSICGKK